MRVISRRAPFTDREPKLYESSETANGSEAPSLAHDVQAPRGACRSIAALFYPLEKDRQSDRQRGNHDHFGHGYCDHPGIRLIHVIPLAE